MGPAGSQADCNAISSGHVSFKDRRSMLTGSARRREHKPHQRHWAGDLPCLMKVQKHQGYYHWFLVNQQPVNATTLAARLRETTLTASWSSGTSMIKSNCRPTLRTGARSSAMRCSTAT